MQNAFYLWNQKLKIKRNNYKMSDYLSIAATVAG